MISPLNVCQKKAFANLVSDHNVFLTGGAGTGKTFVIHKFIEMMTKLGVHVPVVASTGAAAILAGGQTFHRFFGLGVATDIDALVATARAKGYIWDKLRDVRCIILDEVSMLPDYALEAAYRIAQMVKRSDKPWGGIKIIAVGDFRQLPPVVKDRGPIPWAFLSPAWEESEFVPSLLKTPVRSVDAAFVEILGDARIGRCTERIKEFLNSKLVDADACPDDYPRLFGKKSDVENYNLMKLNQLPGRDVVIRTEYAGAEHYLDTLKKDAPVPELLVLRPGALVMMRQNDKDDRFVNGSLGHVVDISSIGITVKLLSGLTVYVTPGTFMHNNELGEVLATAKNFPMSLAWATTIHKSQGATMDRVLLDLNQLWEPGQLYVALSRVRSPDGVKVVRWDKRAFKVDDKVTSFHTALWEEVGGNSKPQETNT